MRNQGDAQNVEAVHNMLKLKKSKFVGRQGIFYDIWIWKNMHISVALLLENFRLFLITLVT